MRLLAALLVLGCCPKSTALQWVHLEAKENEDQAINTVWESYADYAGEPIGLRSAPIVEWIPGIAFDCSSGPRWCQGEYIKRIHLARVSWPNYVTKFSQTKLAHELCHAYFDVGHELCRDDLPPVESANHKLNLLGL